MIKNVFFLLLLLLADRQTFSQALGYYLEKGLQNSPLLKDYQNQINASTYDSLMVVAGQRPQVSANAALLYAPGFNHGTNGYDEAITNGGNYSATLGIQQNIFNRKSLDARYIDLQLQKQSMMNTRKLSVNDLKRVITNQYLSVYSDYSNYLFNQEFLKLMTDEREILKSLVARGIYKQTDYLSLLIESQSQEIVLNQLSAQLTRDVYLINQLCGISDTSKGQFYLPVISQNNQSDLSLSPLFMQYRFDSLKIVNQKTMVGIRYLPKISWTADAGFLSSTVNNVYDHYGFSVGLNLSIPIYDGRQRKLEYEKLAISEDTRSNYESFFKIQYHQQVLQYDDDISANKKVIEQLKSQLNSTRELVVLAKAQVNNGNMPVIEFINAVKNYITVNSSLTQAKLKEYQLINELNYLLQ